MTKVYCRKCFNNAQSRHETAWELLGEALRELFGLELSQLEVKRSEKGKPYIEKKGVYFSLSHAKEYAVCAVSDEGEIGVDIEFERKIPEAVQKRLLGGCGDERAVLEWTKRESWGKLTGEGVFFKGAVPERAVFETSSPEEGYVLTVCREKC
ncbi:MAG: hypothetical protein PUE85_09300 [Firmicutes bacterium]|nr:hypothetical protein [Bacillota bacterium]